MVDFQGVVSTVISYSPMNGEPGLWGSDVLIDRCVETDTGVEVSGTVRRSDGLG